MQHIVLQIKGEELSLGATADMTVMEINLYMDMAKNYLLSQGSKAIDFTIPREHSALNGTVAKADEPVKDAKPETLSILPEELKA